MELAVHPSLGVEGVAAMLRDLERADQALSMASPFEASPRGADAAGQMSSGSGMPEGVG